MLDYRQVKYRAWGFLAMQAAVVGFLTGEWVTNEIVGGIVSGIIAASLVLLVGWARDWWKYRKPWYTEYEPNRDEPYEQVRIEHSDVPQRIPMRLRFNARVHVYSINFDFTGGTHAPNILGLYDWNTKDGKFSQNVEVTSNDRGAWYWHCYTGLLRTPGPKSLQNTITVGLEIQTQETFGGHLLIQLAYEERKRMPKPERIPFYVATTRR